VSARISIGAGPAQAAAAGPTSTRPPVSINSGAADKVSRDTAAAMAAASPHGRALYQATFTNMLAVMSEREGHGSQPGVAAATIVRALTASCPRTMYLTGKDSRGLALLSLLPTPVLDAAKRRVFGLPAPGSLVVSPATE
jgi:hypothetical protein